MWQNVQNQLAALPDFLSGHLLLSVSALLVGIAISLPLGVLAARSDRARGPVLTVASVIQTVPSLALLALMVPVLGGTIGFLPAFMALTLYSILPTLRNTVTGITELDPAVVEAAHGVGMTARQRLWRVELPLAAPVIVAGVRTATVWVVGTATLSTPVGAPSLGNYIFSGLQTRNWISVLFGCVFAAALAIVLDQIIRMLEVALRDRRRKLGMGAVAALVVVVAGGLTPIAVEAIDRATTATQTASTSTGPAAAKAATLAGQSIVIGGKPFTEQYVLSDMLAQRLKSAGAEVRTLQNMGSNILLDALRNNTVDVYVEYTGTVWATMMKRKEIIERTAMYIEVADFLLKQYGILAVARLGFENAYCFAMRRDEAQKLGIRTIADLRKNADRLTIAGDPVFFKRPDWTDVRDAYGLQDANTRTMDSTFMYEAVRDRQVDVIGAYSTDGRISAYDLVILKDPKGAFPPYDAIILISPAARKKPGLIAALSSLSNRIDESLMQQANGLVDLKRESPEKAAAFLNEKIDASEAAE